jgi:hypothetical protein
MARPDDSSAYVGTVPSLASVREESSKGLVPITRVSEYHGESAVSVAATQLGTEFTRTHATRIVQEWIEFLTAGPSAIVELHFVTRTPKAVGARPAISR